MNAYQPMARRLRGQPADRPPSFDIMMTFAAHYIGKPLSEYSLDHQVLVDANLAMLEAFDLDILQAISDPYRETTIWAHGSSFQRMTCRFAVSSPRRPRPYPHLQSIGARSWPAYERSTAGHPRVPRPSRWRCAHYGLGRRCACRSRWLARYVQLVYDFSDRPAWV
jgi:hypothetical protein